MQAVDVERNGLIYTRVTGSRSYPAQEDARPARENGIADPQVAGDEDPTRVTITLPLPAALTKANTQATASVGEVFRYRITVPSTPFTFPLYDVRILDDLSEVEGSLTGFPAFSSARACRT